MIFKRNIFIAFVLILTNITTFSIATRDNNTNKKNEQKEIINEQVKNIKKYYILDGKNENIQIHNCSIQLASKKMKIGGGTFIFTSNKNLLKHIKEYTFEIVLKENTENGKTKTLYVSSVSSHEGNALQYNTPIDIGSLEESQNFINENDLISKYSLYFILKYSDWENNYEERIRLNVSDLDLSFFDD